ncbi:MAG: hypothetical protein H0W72_05185 [Planctomycetes bacterium]|nr:hypothetical protein [Planctomycetota bacterium]
MCHVLYIAAKTAIALVPTASPPSFSVEAVADGDPVRSRFPTGWCVRFVGAHTGCSCGFHSQLRFVDAQSPPDEEFAREEASRQQLAALIAGLAATSAVRLFGCWAGDEGASPTIIQRAPAAWFDKARVPVPEGSLVIVDSAAPCPDDDTSWAREVPPEPSVASDPAA